MQIKQIAYIRSDFVEKFGIPRQSNLADTRAEIHFLPEYQNADALREIEAYDYLWLIWEFSESIRDTWSPTFCFLCFGCCLFVCGCFFGGWLFVCVCLFCVLWWCG